ncbi:hypothetical protein FOCG_07623 [Fusarium oxysporum f. sp. radicis-lycopersici 26381]|nr:uncharacterized protein FOBCDRAFT_281722 [Fusarium oxysporum Fo47]EWZ30473.1 hypothetical protein FOZG_15954 [Fusarium oxysporum Fo47]EXL51802.1 hypothetical protein FOCG_07623 [Fusarium oxysporum f. sp. radicis-lycopersici 26381]QKD62084.1 hypothetical protein FOBCDRAFT_281722 [Fusarium oxysporum Fo47]
MADDWDASAIAAVAALIIALFALLVAVAQALQQYLITGQLIRLCDSVVFGPLPGQGYRVWQFSQFRFRVLYSIPQINLEADLWPKESPHIKSYAIGEEMLPDLQPDSLVDYSASSSSMEIVSNCRVHINTMDTAVRGSQTRSEAWSSSDRSHYTWWQSLGIWMRRKFERIRSVIPQTSGDSWSSSTGSDYTYWDFLGIWLRRKFGRIRSIVPLAKKEQPAPDSNDASVGEASWVSFCKAINRSCGGSVRYRSVTYDADRCPSDLVTAPMQVSMRDIAVMGLTAGMKITDCSFKEKSISMQGAIGTITSSNHPILGPILHFTPRATTSPLPRSLAQWSDDDRGVVNKSWLARTWDVCTVAKVPFNSLKRRTTRRLDDRWTSYQEPDQFSKKQKHKRAFNMAGIVPVDVDRRQGRKKKKAKVKKSGRTGATVSVSVNRRPQDGNWTIIQPNPPPQTAAMEGNGNKEKAKEVQTGTGEDNERHATPLHQLASATELNALEEQDTAPAKEFHQQVPRDDSTSQQAQPSGQSPVIETTPEKHPGQSNNSTQHGTKGKEQSDDIQATPVPEPLVQGQPNMGESTLKLEEGEGQSQRTSLKPDEQNVAAPQTSVGGSPAIFGRPVTRLLLTQTPHWDALPEESPQDSARQEPDIREPRRKATVEDVPDSGDEVASESERPLASETLDRGLAAKKRQEKRNKRSRKIQKDKAIVEESRTSDSRPQFLLTYPGEGLGSEPSNPTPETKEDKAHAREAERRRRREERELERDRRNKSRGNVVSLNRMDMYWFCQVDIYQGFWATPWRPDVPIQTSLVGAVTVILEALLGFLEENVSLVYCNPNRYWTTRDWITYGGISYPAYASNARGGVIARGSYKGVRVPAFQYTVPALELLYSYEWQVSSYLHDQERYCEELNIELMRIDAWLSYVGRTDKIANGPTDLLKGAPALVQLLQADFEVDFMNIDLSAKEGGHQDIQGLADNVMDFLTDEELDEAEQLYILVALLRAVKVCQCVLAGSNTREMEEILMKDVQAHLV